MRELADVTAMQILLIAIGSLLLYVILITTYRLTFHPLAKYPGPLLGRLTGWSIVFQAASGDRHLNSWKEHEVYGPIVRIGPNAVSINTAAALQDVYASRNANVRKSDWYHTIDYASKAYSTHSEIDRQKHSFRRRILEHAFSESALSSAEKFIHHNIDTWCEHLGEGCSKLGDWTVAKNMTDWCTYLGYDIMGDLMFGKRFNCVGSDEHRYVPQVMMESTKLIYILGFLPCVALVRPLLNTPVMDLLAGGLSRSAQKYITYANTQMELRIDAEKNKEPTKDTRKDFSHYLINAKDPQTGKGLTNDELHADSSLIISAGSDTTAVTLSSALFYLLHYPHALEKLTAEIRSSFSSAGQIDGGSTKRVPYLRACVDEALRLSPPVPSHLPREVLPGGQMVDGHYFPPGTIVGTSAYAIHHNVEYYPDPFKYRPERWIVDEKAGGIQSPDSVRAARTAFCPFSLGRRGCIGKNIAYREMEIALGKLLYTYDICLPESQSEREPSGEGVSDHENPQRRRREEYQLVEHFIPIRKGPMVQFRAVDKH